MFLKLQALDFWNIVYSRLQITFWLMVLLFLFCMYVWPLDEAPFSMVISKITLGLRGILLRLSKFLNFQELVKELEQMRKQYPLLNLDLICTWALIMEFCLNPKPRVKNNTLLSSLNHVHQYNTSPTGPRSAVCSTLAYFPRKTPQSL